MASPPGSGILGSGGQQERGRQRIYLPPDANCLLSVADHCLRSRNYVNVIVADKQKHCNTSTWTPRSPLHQGHRHLGMGQHRRRTRADVSWPRGDVPTKEALAAAALLRQEFPTSSSASSRRGPLSPATRERTPARTADRDFDSLFTVDRPVIFAFHGYPALIHRLAYRRANHDHLHVRGYKEKGNINTPLELAIENQVDRFSLAIDVIDRVPRLRPSGACARAFPKRPARMPRPCARGRRRPASDADWVWPYGPK